MKTGKVKIEISERTAQEVCETGDLINQVTGKTDTTFEEVIAMSITSFKVKLIEILSQKSERRRPA